MNLKKNFQVNSPTILPMDNQSYNSCLNCGDEALNWCERCHAFYCSLECQKSDWLKHKPNCNLMSKVASQNIDPAPALSSVSIEKDSNVFITHVRTHRLVYIRSFTTNDEYTKLISDVQESSHTQPKLTVYPNQNDLVMAPLNDLYYRAIVIYSDRINEMARVGFIDLGNVEEVPFADLKTLPEELCTHRRLTIPVTLKNVHNEYEQIRKKEMCEVLNDLSDRFSVLKVKVDKAKVVENDFVELFNPDTKRSINKTFNEIFYRIENLKQKIVNASNIKIIGLGEIHDNYVTCILDTDIIQFMENNDKVQVYGASVKNAPAHKPKQGELCVVESKQPKGEIWYRCQYLQEMADDHALVHCIDFATNLKVYANKIRTMNEEMTFEITSFVGLLENGDKLSKNKKTALTKGMHTSAKSITYDGSLHRIILA